MIKDNSSSLDECFNEGYVISLAALVPVLSLSIFSGVAAVFLNILVIWAIYRNSILRCITNYWIVSLAVADLLLGILGVPVWCLKLLHKARIIKVNVHNIFTCILVLTLVSSSLNLLALSFDRFIGVTSPFRYPALLTRERCRKGIAVIWALSALAAIASLRSKCTVNADGHLLLFALIIGAPSIFICYFYFRIFKEAIRQKRLIMVQQQSSSGQARFVKENKAAMTVAMVIGSFALCWIPSLIDAVIHLVAPSFWRNTQLYLGTTPLACFSSAVNPILYSVRNKTFRNSFRSVFMTTRVCPRNVVTDVCETQLKVSMG